MVFDSLSNELELGRICKASAGGHNINGLDGDEDVNLSDFSKDEDPDDDDQTNLISKSKGDRIQPSAEKCARAMKKTIFFLTLFLLTMIVLLALISYIDMEFINPWNWDTSITQCSSVLPSERPSFSAESHFPSANLVSVLLSQKTDRLRNWERYNELLSKCNFDYDTPKDYAINPRYKLPTVVQKCTLPDPSEAGVMWSFQRLGPYSTYGGYNWMSWVGRSLFDIDDYLPEDNKNVTLLAGTVYAADMESNAIPYPPIHIHHAHLFPYLKETMTEKRFVIKDGHADEPGGHCVIFQNHGDSWCSEEDGGPACLLKTAPEGHGFRIFDYDGMILDMELNDVRPSKSSRQNFFALAAVKWTQEERAPATYLQFGNPQSGKTIGSTYRFKRRRATALYFNYTHDNLGSGKVAHSSVVMHAHQSQFDSWWLFKGKGVYAALEKYRVEKGYNIPITEAKNEDNIIKLKQEIIGAIKKDGGEDVELICEVDKPCMSCWEKDGHLKKSEYPEMLYDRRVDVKCAESIRLEEGETLTVVVFNYPEKAQKTLNLDWIHYRNLGHTIEEIEKEETLQQHTIFRGDYIRDDAQGLAWSSGTPGLDVQEGKFAPPAKWEYAYWPDGTAEHFEPEYIGDLDP